MRYHFETTVEIDGENSDKRAQELARDIFDLLDTAGCHFVGFGEPLEQRHLDGRLYFVAVQRVERLWGKT